MRAIHIKLVRELWGLRWQALAIAMVMACGVATEVMSLSTLDSLERTRQGYFDGRRFAHVFAHLKRAPESVAARLRQIPGIGAVETRIVAGVTLQVVGLAEPATGRLISLPENSPLQLNLLHLRQGRFPEPGRTGEVLVSEAFATAHGFTPTSELRAVLNGRLQTFHIVGIVLSPEFIYSTRPGELLPDDKRFGVVWMSERELAPAFNLEGAFNDACFSLLPGAQEAEVVRQVDEILDPYGGTGAFGRADQPSYRFLENELVQLRGIALLPPVIFLAVTAFLLNVVMARLTATQREQIAALRAFGYTRREIAAHYLMLAVAIALVGTLSGIAVGVWGGIHLTTLYARFFHFPEFAYHLDPRIAIVVTLISGVSALAGVWATVAKVVREPPAKALQPEAPARYRQSILERLGLIRWISPPTRMILRHIDRRRWRAALSCIGIALSLGILVLGNFSEDAVEFVMTFQFERVQRQDVMVTFVEPTSGRVIHDVRHLPGVMHVEPFRSVPIRVRFGPRSRRLGIFGLPQDSILYRPLDENARPIDLPPDGLVISQALADALACQPGDEVLVEVLEGERPTYSVPVIRTVSDFFDLNAYMRLDALHRMMREQNAVSGSFLSVDTNRLDALYAKLKNTPRVSGVSIKRFSLESYRNTMAENLLRMKTINVIFASLVAFGVIYNCARISLAEHNRELATLRVLGFSRDETSYILMGELALLVIAAIPIGCVFGYGFAWLLGQTLRTEVHRFPVMVSWSTYAFATLTTIVSSVISAMIVRRRFVELNLVSVLKARD